MVLNLEQLKDAVIELPDDERAELMRFLVKSISGPEAAEIRAQWLAVANERMDEIRSGKVQGIPADEVLRTLLDPDS